MTRGRGYSSAWVGFWLAVGMMSRLAPAVAAGPDCVPGRLVVRERAGLQRDALQHALRAHGVRRVDGVEQLGAIVVEAPDGELSATQAALRRSGLFKSVELDYLAEIAETPNDPYYNTQWGLPRIGVPAAWGLSSGAGITVAVLDTGVELTHPDLQGALTTGYDFLNGDNDPRDDNGHGTRMTGIIAARRNNAEGIAGIAPDATVLPVKVLDALGHGPYSVVANGITYAVDHGARILSLSLAGTAKSSILDDAVSYARAHDVVVVAAAGNYGNNLPVYPAASAGATGVGSLDETDTHSGFSNYGAWVSFAAPGEDIVTTSLNGGYGSSTGTSPAAAVGAGVFALLRAANPTMSSSEAIARVEAGALDLSFDGWDPYYGWGRVDAYAALVPNQHGGPLPDATDPTVTLLSPSPRSLVSGLVPVDVAANDNVAISRVDLLLDNQVYATATLAPYSFVIDAAALVPGQHKLRAIAYDTSNNWSRTPVLKFFFTPGSGLLVDKATAKPSRVTIKAQFALPEGATFDPSVDPMTIELTSASGVVLSATAQAGSLSSVGGRMQGTFSAAVPSAGSVRVTTGYAGDQPLFTLKVKATNLSGMNSLQTLMNLGVSVGGSQLSQSLSFRAKSGTTLVYP